MLERNELMRQRLAKIAAARAAGHIPYPNDFVPNATSADAYAWFAADPRRLAPFSAVAEDAVPAAEEGAMKLPAPWTSDIFSSSVICSTTMSARWSGGRLLSIHGPLGACCCLCARTGERASTAENAAVAVATASRLPRMG